MWTLEVASVLGRNWDTRSAVKTGHDVKSLRLMDRMKVLLDGPKQEA